MIYPGEYSMCTWKECVFCCFRVEYFLSLLLPPLTHTHTHTHRKFICFNVSFKTSILLLVFSLDEAFIDVSGMLNSPTSIVLLSISPFMLINTCFMYLDAPMLGAYICTIVLFVGSILSSLYNVLFLSLVTVIVFVCFV